MAQPENDRYFSFFNFLMINSIIFADDVSPEMTLFRLISKFSRDRTHQSLFCDNILGYLQTIVNIGHFHVIDRIHSAIEYGIVELDRMK